MLGGGAQAAARRAAGFLAKTQLPDGSFQSFSSPALSPFRPNLTYQTVFVPALILQALHGTDDPGIAAVRGKLAAWLLTQKSPQWSFNYWAQAAPQRQTLPYPDDLDDTFCALIALHNHDSALIDQACLARVVKLLIAAETKPGGPYRTWLAGKDAPNVWRDVDLAVNSNIACFLNLVAEPLPNLTALMDQAIQGKTFTSPYYPSAFPILYYLARAYRGDHAAALADYLARTQKNGHWGGPLATALAVNACLQLGSAAPCAPAIKWLLAKQQADGSWPAEAFCIDPAIQNRTHYNGAAALTTAIVLEALQSYAGIAARTPRAAAKKTVQPNPVHASIIAAAVAAMASLGPVLAATGQTALKRMDERDTNHEITLLPTLFAASLAKTPVLPPSLLQQLGLANLYGWMAYTIYDDFLDDEGQPRLLPLANVALRRSVQAFYQALSEHADFQTQVAETFDIIDEANAWEVAHCRYTVSKGTITIGAIPDYQDSLRLADRSLGHTLAPLGVLAAQGTDLHSPAARAVQTALRHYIVARQLSDDLHDWQDDLKRGHITYVVAAILEDLRVKPGRHSLAKLVPLMQRQFWHHSLPILCDKAVWHSQRARIEAQKSQLLPPKNIITKLVGAIDDILKTTKQEQQKVEAFLATFRSG